MAYITASQQENTKTFSYSWWGAPANTWWSVEIYDDQNNYLGGNESGDGATSGSGLYTPDSYGDFILKLWVSPDGYVAQTSVTTQEPAVEFTCFFEYYYNNRYLDDDFDDLTVDGRYSFLIGFSPSSDRVLDKITSNIYNDQLFPEYNSIALFDGQSYDFTIRYYTVDLEISSSSVTDNTITMQIDDPAEIKNAAYYIWGCNGATYYGLTPTFYSLSPNTSYEITLSVRDSGYNQLGFTSCTVSTSGGSSNIKIFSDGEWHQATPWIYSDGEWRQATGYIYINNNWQRC